MRIGGITSRPSSSHTGMWSRSIFAGMGAAGWSKDADYGPPSYIHDVRALIDHLGTKVVLIGHSMGGAVAQWCAVTFPEKLAALIIVDAPAGSASTAAPSAVAMAAARAGRQASRAEIG